MSGSTLPRRSLPAPIPSHPTDPAARRSASPDGIGRPPRRAVLVGALALSLAACSGGGETGSSASSDGGSDAGADSTGGTSGAGAALSIADPWAKAADDGMTAAFGTVRNDGDQAVTIIGARTDAAQEVQLHETADDGSGGMSMQEKEGGFELAAGATLELTPGGEHLMLMGLTAPLQPGDALDITLELADGTEVPFTATVKDYAGAQEDYAPGEGEESGHDGAQHDGASDAGGRS